MDPGGISNIPACEELVASEMAKNPPLDEHTRMVYRMGLRMGYMTALVDVSEDKHPEVINGGIKRRLTKQWGK